MAKKIKKQKFKKIKKDAFISNVQLNKYLATYTQTITGIGYVTGKNIKDAKRKAHLKKHFINPLLNFENSLSSLENNWQLKDIEKIGE